MNCNSCQFDNPPGFAFCGKCGSPLGAICSKCGFAIPAGLGFCGKCGNPLVDAKTTPPDQNVSVSAPAYPLADAPGERRNLTVMFCDLVGSTALSGQLDPEDLRDVIRSYHEAAARAVADHGGFIGQYLGDGLLVYFGYPQAYEDAAARGVRAGLGILAAIARLDGHATRIEARVGVHTGVVIMGDIGAGTRREAHGIIGQTPNIAARVQSLAEAGALVISETTYRLLRREFTCDDLGTPPLKGVSEQLRMFRVRGPARGRPTNAIVGTDNHTDHATPMNLPFVGREKQIESLLDRWALARDGAGQVVLIGGEAGLGKSRLLRAFREKVSDGTQVWREARGSSYSQESAFAPLIKLLEQLMEFQDGESNEQKLDRVIAFSNKCNLVENQAVPLLASLLSVPFEVRFAALNVSPQTRRRRTMETLMQAIIAEARRQPLIIAVEDLHWLDSSSLELLVLLIDQVAAAAVLLVLTARPEFQPPWPMRSHLTYLTLDRLPRDRVVDMVRGLTGGRPLPPEVLRQLTARADGVPLFVEELTKTVLESGLLQESVVGNEYELAGPLPALAVPATLHDSLMARLDRLATVKEVAQIAATIGREFDYDLLAAVCPFNETTLQHELGKLVGAELLYQKGIPPHASYVFKHALIQEEAYESCLRRRRQQYHQRIAEALEQRFTDNADRQPELVARHYTEALLAEKSVKWWLLAATRAVESSAMREAISHLRQGLAVLGTLPECPQRDGMELQLKIAIAIPLLMVKGYGADEVRATYGRARELCDKLGAIPEKFPIVAGLYQFHLIRAEFSAAKALADELQSLGTAVGDPRITLYACLFIGIHGFYTGAHAICYAQTRDVMSSYVPKLHDALVYTAGQDALVAAGMFHGWAACVMGMPREGLVTAGNAVKRAEQLSHIPTVAVSEHIMAVISYHLRDAGAVLHWADRVLKLSHEQDFPFYIGATLALKAWAIGFGGKPEQGVAILKESAAILEMSGSRLTLAFDATQAAEMYGMLGQFDEAMQAISKGLEFGRLTDEHIQDAELHRLKAEIMILREDRDPDQAEQCFREAIRIAELQGAKLFQLRATVGLARHLAPSSRHIDLLPNIEHLLKLIDDGSDIEDVLQARELLQRLRDKGVTSKQ